MTSCEWELSEFSFDWNISAVSGVATGHLICFVIRANYELQLDLQLRFDYAMWMSIKFYWNISIVSRIATVMYHLICFVIRANYELQLDLQLRFDDVMWMIIK